jgi:hypothetical protein
LPFSSLYDEIEAEVTNCDFHIYHLTFTVSVVSRCHPLTGTC